MVTTTALSLASARDASTPSPVLASRPGSRVLHVFVTSLTRSRRFTPRTAAPVCRRTPPRRLHAVVSDDPSPRVVGDHTNGQRLCCRCAAQLARAAAVVGDLRASWAYHLLDGYRLEDAGTAGMWHGREHAVYDRADRRVGMVAVDRDGRGRQSWKVVDAGTGVPVPKRLTVGSERRAVEALGICRELASLPGGPLHTIDGLRVLDRQVLDLAAEVDRGDWPLRDTYTGRRAGYLDAEIRSRLHMSPDRYTQLLNKLLDNPHAAGYAPAVVNLRRARRDRNTARRTA